jgi:hypothetical protein
MERYKTGLETCRNAYPQITGSVCNRPGFRMVAPVKNTAYPPRIVKFIYSTSQVFYIEVGNYYMRFYTQRAQIQATGVGAWVTSTSYVVGDFVTNGGNTYYCLIDNTSGTFATDLAAGDWVLQTAYEIPTPYAQADLNNLRFEESADFVYIAHQNYPQMILERLGDADWSLVSYLDQVIDGPFMDENTDITSTLTTNVTTGTGIMTAVNPIFNAQHIGALWRKTDYIEGQNVVLTATGTGTSGSIPCFTSWLLITEGTWAANFQLEMSEDGGNTWTVLQYFTGDSNFNVDTSNTESVTDHLVPFLLRVNITSYTSGTITITLSALPFYQDGFVQITGFISTTQVDITVLQTLGTTAACIAWAEGAWSPYRGYPGTVRFYQDRLCWAGAPKSQADSYWLTVDGDYISFLVSTPGEDSDGISEQLSSRQLNAINGMVGFQSLLMLTNSTGWAVQPISGASLTPSTIDQSIQDYNGSDGIEPVVIGNEAIFSQFQGKIIRSILYNFYTQSFTSAELNPFARHLLKDWSVVSMCYQQNPDNIVWMLRSDGQLIALTYLKEQDVIGWHHHDTNGVFNSIDAAPGVGYTEVWASVTRPNGGFIEVLENRITNDVRQSFFLDNGISNTVSVLSVTNIQKLPIYLVDDSGNVIHDDSGNPFLISQSVQVTIPSHGLATGDIVEFDSILGMSNLNGNQYSMTVVDSNNFTLQDVYDGTTIDGTKYGTYISGGNCIQCFTTFTGLSYLNGQTVSILGDGFVFPQQVVSGGSITLPRACGYVQIGMQYLSDVETLPVELSMWFNPAPPMTTQGRRVKIGNVTFGFVDSRGGWLGVNVNDVYGNPELREGFFPPRTNQNQVIQLYTGDLHQVVSGGWEEGARIFYRQQDPLPFTITRIIPTVIVGGETSLAGGSYIQSLSGVGTITP